MSIFELVMIPIAINEFETDGDDSPVRTLFTNASYWMLMGDRSPDEFLVRYPARCAPPAWWHVAPVTATRPDTPFQSGASGAVVRVPRTGPTSQQHALHLSQLDCNFLPIGGVTRPLPLCDTCRFLAIDPLAASTAPS